MSTDWGDVPGWIEAIATVGAFVGAVVAIVVATKVYRVELDRENRQESLRRRDEDERRRDHASQISLWSHRMSTAVASAWGRSRAIPGARVLNDSKQPIYNGVLDWHLNDRLQAVKPLGTIAPGETFAAYPNDMNLWTGTVSSDSARDVPDLYDRMTVSLTFTDSHGRRWTREPDGGLTEHKTTNSGGGS